MTTQHSHPLASDVFAHVTEMIDQPETEGGVPQHRRSSILRAMQREYGRLWGKLCDLDKTWGWKLAELTVTAGSRIVALPDDVRNVRFVIEIDSAGEELPPGVSGGRWDDLGSYAGGTRVPWKLDETAKQLYLMATPTAGSTHRLVYHYRPVPVMFGNVQLGTTNTLDLEAHELSHDDAYIGGVVHIVSGTGAGQSDVVTDFSGFNHRATFAGPWSPVPDTSSRYSGEIILPPDGQDALENGIAARLLRKNRDARSVNYEAARSQYLEELETASARSESATSEGITDEAGFTDIDDDSYDYGY